MKLYYTTHNNASAVKLSDIPVVDYTELYNDLAERMNDSRYHVAHYFATEHEMGLKFYLIILDDLLLSSHFNGGLCPMEECMSGTYNP